MACTRTQSQGGYPLGNLALDHLWTWEKENQGVNLLGNNKNCGLGFVSGSSGVNHYSAESWMMLLVAFLCRRCPQGVLLTVFCQALSAVLSQPEHPIINPFLLVTWQRSMSEQAIETVAIKWTPVNPVGYLLRAYGKGREFFSNPVLFPYPYTLCCFHLGSSWHLPRPVKYTGNPCRWQIHSQHLYSHLLLL